MSQFGPPQTELASIDWFAHYMSLNNTGLIPTVTPTELLPTRHDMAEFWGPKHGSGHYFESHGNPLYEIYVHELHSRVVQLNWPITGVIPFHFARGLLAEAQGCEIDWATFAYKVTHPHQSHSGIPRVLPQFLELREPLPPLKIVLPFEPTEVRVSCEPLVSPRSTSQFFVTLHVLNSLRLFDHVVSIACTVSVSFIESRSGIPQQNLL